MPRTLPPPRSRSSNPRSQGTVILCELQCGVLNLNHNIAVFSKQEVEFNLNEHGLQYLSGSFTRSVFESLRVIIDLSCEITPAYAQRCSPDHPTCPMIYRMLANHRSPRTVSTQLRTTNHQSTIPPRRKLPLRSLPGRNLTPIYYPKTSNAHVVVKQPNRFCNLDASPCSTTVSTCGIAHDVLLSLAGHQSANPSAQEINDAFDVVPPTKLLGPRIPRSNRCPGVGVYAMTSSLGKTTWSRDLARLDSQNTQIRSNAGHRCKSYRYRWDKMLRVAM
jgi:hypothetical protein